MLESAALISLLVPLVAAPPPGGPGEDEPRPAHVLELARRAEAASRAGRLPETVELLEQVVELNPVHPHYWYSLGRARYGAKDYARAIEAYERAAELGAPLMGAYYSVYGVACCHALAGETELALAALERAFALGFPDLHGPARDPDLASLRDEPRFRELLGLADVSAMTRDEGWRHDLAVLAREVRRKGFNPQLYVQRRVTLEQFDERVRALSDEVPGLSDGQVVLRMMELMAFLEDGHSAVWDFGDNALFRGALPLQLLSFEDGVFVGAADRRHEDLLGARVDAFDGRRTEDVLATMARYDGADRGNPLSANRSYKLRRLALLHAAGLVDSPERVTLTVRDRSGAVRQATVEQDTKYLDIWNTLPAPAPWATVVAGLDDPPLYVRHMDQYQWFEHLPDARAVYFQFNKVLDGPRESLEAFTRRLLAFVEANDVDTLVIDLRWNNGGDTSLAEPLLLGLIACEKVNRRGGLFVLIGRRTYSAAQNVSTYLERWTEATFVGEPTGSSPNFVGEEVPMTLPYSKVMANVSHLFWQSSWPQDQRMWLAPSIYVAPTFADFAAGRDAALEAALEAVAR